MESIVPGVPDRGGNDHYALRGTLAWQPSDATERQPDPALHERGQGDAGRPLFARAGLPECQVPGRIHAARRSPALSGARGPGESRHAASATIRIIPSRGGDPWKTAETRASYVDREIFGAHGARRSEFGGCDFTSITRLPDVRTSSTSRAATPRPTRACSSSRAATSTRPRRSSACRATRGAHELVGGRLRHEGGRRLHRQVRRSVLRLRPGRRVHAGARSPTRRSCRTNGASPSAGS